MNLNKLTVRILRALLVARGNSTARADHRIGRLAKDQARPTSCHDHSIGRKGFQLERLEVHRNEAATDLMIVEYQRHHLPVLKLSDLAVHFVAPHLLVERVEQLLSG